MTKLQSFLIKLFAALFTAAFLWLGWLCLCEGSPLLPLAWWVVVLVALGVAAASLAVLWAGTRLGARLRGRALSNDGGRGQASINNGGQSPRSALRAAVRARESGCNPLTRDPARRAEVLLLALGFALYLALQLYFAFCLVSRRGYGWDFGVVAGAAMDAVTSGVPGGGYFRMWPNNIPLFLLLVGVMRPFAAFGFHNLAAVGIGLNLFAIDAAILLVYLCLKKLTHSRTAGFCGLFLCFVTLPLLSYVPIYYTDTLTLPFAVFGFYLWLCAKERVAAGRVWPALGFAAALGAVLALGALLKVTVLFFLIAVAVDALVTLRTKRFLALVAAAVVLFGAVYFPLKSAANNSPLLVAGTPDDYIPSLHWVMMGLSGNGNYNDDDYQLTLSVPGGERDEFVKREIARRLDGLGAAGLLAHLHEKCAFVWGEGTYYSAIKLDRDRAHASPLDPYLLHNGTNFAVSAYFEQGLFWLNLVCAAALGILLLRGQRGARALLPCGISLFGLFAFLCAWEARSRYLFNYLPLLLIMTAWCLWTLWGALRRRG